MNFTTGDPAAVLWQGRTAALRIHIPQTEHLNCIAKVRSLKAFITFQIILIESKNHALASSWWQPGLTYTYSSANVVVRELTEKQQAALLVIKEKVVVGSRLK